MRFIGFLILLLSSLAAKSDDLLINDYQWFLTDISKKDLTKEKIFSEMDRDFININSAICSNSAHMWANDFKKKYDIQSGKIFLFFTKKNSQDGLKTWWYHASPLINENGDIWIMDAGYPYSLKEPSKLERWFEFFAKTKSCKEIDGTETELIELMFEGQVFPEKTLYGKYDCYYKIVPHTIWTPSIVAKSLLERDQNGRPVKIDWQENNKRELYQACIESTTTKLTYSLKSSRYRCRKYAEQ